METTTTTYGELQNGDRVFVQGYLFQVSGLTRTHKDDPCNAFQSATWDWQTYGEFSIRFTGHVVDPSSDIKGTCYDGGRYGGADKVRIVIVRRPVCSNCGATKPHDQSCACVDNQ